MATHSGASINWIPTPIARHPALIAACCLCIGVFIGDRVDGDPAVFLTVAVAMGLIGLVLAKSRVPRRRVAGVLAVGLALIALGAWRIAVANSGRPSKSLGALTASGRRVDIFARVDGVPFQKSSGWRVPLDLIAIRNQTGDLPVKDRVLLTSLPSLQGLRFGDYIRFQGRAYAPSVQRNPGGFDYAEYLHLQGFDATLRPESQLTRWPQELNWSLHNIIDPVRQWIRGTFGENLEDAPQALLVGLLLGDTDRLPKPVYDAFRESGTSHLLAVSGANVWLVVGMILLPMYIFSVPRWPRTIIALAVIVLFSFLTRNEPSVVRASLMVALILAGQLLWRPVAPLNAVGAAALIILLLAPSHLFRPGFQLSFAAVIGILVAVGRAEPLLRGFWRKRWVYTIVLFIVASVAATVATAPIAAWHFGTVPVVGVLSNLIMVPLAGLAAYLGLLLLPLQAVTSTGTKGLSWVIEHLLAFSTQTAQFFADISWAVISWPSPSVLVLIHLLIVVMLFLNWRHRYQWLRPLTYYVCFAMTAIAMVKLTAHSPSFASISLLDTGRQRVAVLSSTRGPALGLIDDPGLDDDIDQWVVQPFLRHQIGKPTLDTWSPWRRLAGPTSSGRSPNGGGHSWKRLYSNEDLDSLGHPRIWADLWQSETSDILMFRDPPNFSPTQVLCALDYPLRSPMLILPSNVPVEWIRDVIDTSYPVIVILYGRAQFGRSPEETLDFWRLRFPRIEFYSTAVHGGITLDLVPEKARLITTVPERPALGR